MYKKIFLFLTSLTVLIFILSGIKFTRIASFIVQRDCPAIDGEPPLFCFPTEPVYIIHTISFGILLILSLVFYNHLMMRLYKKYFFERKKIFKLLFWSLVVLSIPFLILGVIAVLLIIRQVFKIDL